MEISREDLLQICADALVPQEKWHDRDSASAQRQLGECFILLSAGCDYTVREGAQNMLWVHVFYNGFSSFEYGRTDPRNQDDEEFYVPTRERLDRNKGGDWY